MSRHIFQSAFVDQNGNAVQEGNITVYLAGTTDLATIYSVVSGGSAVTGSVVTSDNSGNYSFYVDTDDYSFTQLFKIIPSKDTFVSVPRDYIEIIPTGAGAFESISSTNIVFKNKKLSVNESSPDVDAGGLCLNQGAEDGNILSFKSSDIAHGVTGVAETDTYGQIKKFGTTVGGLTVEGITESFESLVMRGTATTEDTSKANSSTGNLRCQAFLKSGSSNTAHGANSNLMVIVNQTNTRFIFDADGDSHQDVGTAWTNFDDYEDALAVKDCMTVLGNKKQEFQKFIKYNARKLHAMGVITYTPKEKSSTGKDEMFLSSKGILGLYGGAIGELFGVIDLLAKKAGIDYDTLRKQFRKNNLLHNRGTV